MKTNQFFSFQRNPTVRELIQNYFAANLLPIFTRIKIRVADFIPKQELKYEEIKEEPNLPSPIRAASISFQKFQPEKRPFITQPRLQTWDVWESVDDDIKMELDFSQPRYFMIKFMINSLSLFFWK